MSVEPKHLVIPMPPWLLRLIAGHDLVDQFARNLRFDAGIATYVLRGRRMTHRDGVFDEFAAALQFPLYFGRNWNAFVDCLQDLEWHPWKACAIIIADSDAVLTRGDKDEFSLLLQFLTEAGESLAGSNEFREARSFHVILHAAPTVAHSLDMRLSATGITPSPIAPNQVG